MIFLLPRPKNAIAGMRNMKGEVAISQSERRRVAAKARRTEYQASTNARRK